MTLLVNELSGLAQPTLLVLDDREYVIRLLTACGERTFAPQASPLADSGLVEPLSARELEVLRLVGQGLSNREIADKLVSMTCEARQEPQL